MTDPDTDKKSTNGEENETDKSAMDDSVTVPLEDDLDESKAQLIRSNGGAGDHAEVVIIDGTEKSSDQVSFNGLGKDEVMQYANDPFWVRLRWFLFILFWVGWFAMLVTAVVIIVVAPRCPPRPDLKWYQKDAVYHAYAKSFKDSDKDGLGDFKGLKDKLDYITDDVGANALYLSSIFKTDTDPAISSEDADFAIVDHKDLDPKFGTTVAKLKSWIKDLRKKGQNVIVDLIPNQTGKKHEWFEKSRKSDKDYKDYYIWAGSGSNGSSVNSPPNAWKNMYGDSAWEFDNERNQFYYHSRSKDLPDLNLNNEAVRKELLDIVKFWFGAGIGGFNIKDLQYLVEEKDTSKADGQNFNGTMAFLKELRDIANDYSDKPGRERFLFGNVDSIDNDTMKYWENDGEVLHMIAPQMPLANCDAACITKWIETIPDSGNNWLALQLSNPDQSRFSSKVTGQAPNFVKTSHAVQMLLPGTPFNYYGDEFGQQNGVESDVSGRFNPKNARTPMQWTDEKNVGFTEDGVTPWNPVGPNYKNNNLRVSRAHYNDHSSFRLLKKLIDLRERESFQWGKTKACAPNKNLLLFTRKAERFPYFLTLINLSDTVDEHPDLTSLKSCVESKEMGKVVFHSREDYGDKRDFSEAVQLSPGDIMVIEFAADD